MELDIETITQAVRDALSHRDARRDVLAQRIHELAKRAMDAARVRSIDLDDPCAPYASSTGTIAYRTPVADCSQWSNRIDHPGHRGAPCLMLRPFGERNWRSFGPPPDVGFFDGHNMQYQQGAAREQETGANIRPATVAQLWEVAYVLPGTLAKLLAETSDRALHDAAEADAALKSL